MPEYSAVHDLIMAQPYINSAFPIHGWIPEHEDCAVQPWKPQVEVDESGVCYGLICHLTYRKRPLAPLILNPYEHIPVDWPTFPILPFLESRGDFKGPEKFFAYAFNHMYPEMKAGVLRAATEEAAKNECVPVDVSKMPFVEAASCISKSSFFLGCRSANYVIAQGLAKKILTIEPEPGRRENIFSCPWGWEAMPDPKDLGTFMRLAKEWSR